MGEIQVATSIRRVIVKRNGIKLNGRGTCQGVKGARSTRSDMRAEIIGTINDEVRIVQFNIICQDSL